MTREERADAMMKAWFGFVGGLRNVPLDEILFPIVRNAWFDGWDRGRTVGVQDGIDMAAQAELLGTPAGAGWTDASPELREPG